MKRLLLQAAFALLPSAAFAYTGAVIHYFDNDYRVSMGLAGAVERIASSSAAVKLDRVISTVTYTNGARFVLSDPDGVTTQELASAVYEFEERTVLLDGGNSLLMAPRGFDKLLDAGGLDGLASALNAEAAPAEILSGRTLAGKNFTVVHLPFKAEKPVWDSTVRMDHRLSVNGSKAVFTTFGVPQGMENPTEETVEEAANKDENVLLSVGAGGRTADEDGAAALRPVLDFLASAGTDIVALGPRDLKNLWLLQAKDSLPRRLDEPDLVFTNAAVSDQAFADRIKPYAVRRFSGRTVAFICLVPSGPEERYALAGAPVKLWDPRNEDQLAELLAGLRAKEKADAVVAVSFYRKQDAGWLAGTPGIDVVISKYWDGEVPKRTRAELAPGAAARAGGPALTVLPDSSGAGRVNLEFGRDGGLAAAESLSLHAGGAVFGAAERAAMKEATIRLVLGSGDAVLPDPRRLALGGSEPMPFYAIPDFHALAANLLRRRAKAEVSVIRINANGSSVLGDTPSSLVRTWLGPDEPLELAMVPGSVLRGFFRAQPPALSPQARYSLRAFQGREYYALSGVDAEGRVGGLPLRDSELYLTVAPAGLLQGKPVTRLTQAHTGTLHECVVKELRALKTASKSRADWESAVKAGIANQQEDRPIWRINLRSLSLQASNVAVGGPSAYAGTGESRLSATDQTRIQGSGRLFSEYYHGRFRLDSGVSADYGKVVLRPENGPRVTAESVDRVLFESELRYRLRTFDGALGQVVLGPFASAEYETEFSRAYPEPLRRIVRAKGGLKLFEGARLQEFYAGLTTEQVLTYYPYRIKFAAETGFEANVPLPGTALVLNVEGNYRRFARSHFDTDKDLKDRLELNARLSAKLYGDITINPYASYLLATGKKLPGSASNLTTGFSLAYTHLFKIKR